MIHLMYHKRRISNINGSVMFVTITDRKENSYDSNL